MSIIKSIKEFLRRKDIIFSGKRYGIDALGAMAQGLFCTLLVGTILNTIGQQFHIGFLNAILVTIGKGEELHHRRPGQCHGRSRHCHCHRLCAELPQYGAVQPDSRGLCR